MKQNGDGTPQRARDDKNIEVSYVGSPFSLLKAVFVGFGFIVLPNWMHGKRVLQALTNQIVDIFVSQ